MKKRNGFTAGLMMSAALFAAGVLYTACEQPDVDLNPLKEKLKEKDNPAPSPEGEAEEEDVTGAGGLISSLNWVKANGTPGSNHIITVMNDETIKPYTLSAKDSPNLNNITITLQSADSAAKRIQLSKQGALLTVDGNITLIFQDIIFEGLSKKAIEGCTTDPYDNNSALIVMKEGSSLQMRTGSQITGNTNINDTGGGVYFSGDTFTMSDNAAISRNTANEDGGGIYFSDGAFKMSGGSISGNTAGNYGRGGGVYFTAGGTFTMSMSGGSISENTADSWGGGIFFGGGTFTMSGGSISRNTANEGGGVFRSVGTFTMSGGSISGNAANEGGGGVYIMGLGINSRNFIMSGGSISGNTAGHGGGVSSSGGFTMSGGTISGNTASSNYYGYGGGVAAYNTFTMSDNAVISGNTASDFGGGIYCGGNFEMSGGSISGNTASSTDSGNGSGGGVYVDGSRYNSTFSKTGGVIYGSDGDSMKNTAKTDGQAVYYNSDYFTDPPNSVTHYCNTTAGPDVNLSTDDFTTNWEQ